MSKISDFFEKYTSKEGEEVYRYNSLLRPANIHLSYYFSPTDPEILEIKAIEIPSEFEYIDFRLGYFFSNLEKVIVAQKRETPPSIPFCFERGAFAGCHNIHEVHLYHTICFANLSGSLGWTVPFRNSKDVTFIWHDKSYMDMCSDAINRWGMKAKFMEEKKDESVPKMLHF